MSKVLRIVTTWLLLLAIPLQGVAAVVAPLCGPGGVIGAVQDGPEGVACTSHVHHQHACADQDPHARHGHLIAQDISDSGQAGPDGETASQHGHVSISCCSVTGSMAAAFPPLFADRVQPQSSAPVPQAEQIFAGVILDSLDRPPRHFLA